MLRNIIITTTSILVVATLKTPRTTSILVAGSQRVKYLNNLSPHYIQDHINLFSDFHDYTLRDPSLLVLPEAKSNYMKRSFKFQGPQFWNSLPLKNCCNLVVFKTNMKKYLLNRS